MEMYLSKIRPETIPLLIIIISKLYGYYSGCPIHLSSKFSNHLTEIFSMSANRNCPFSPYIMEISCSRNYLSLRQTAPQKQCITTLMHPTVERHFSPLRRNFKHLSSSRTILHPPIQPRLFAAQLSIVRQNMSQLMAVLWSCQCAGKSSFLTSYRESFSSEAVLSPARPPCTPHAWHGLHCPRYQRRMGT